MPLHPSRIHFFTGYLPEVIEQIRASNKVAVIKALRAASDMDLAAAKQAVDAIAASPVMR